MVMLELLKRSCPQDKVMLGLFARMQRRCMSAMIVRLTPPALRAPTPVHTIIAGTLGRKQPRSQQSLRVERRHDCTSRETSTATRTATSSLAAWRAPSKGSYGVRLTAGHAVNRHRSRAGPRRLEVPAHDALALQPADEIDKCQHRRDRQRKRNGRLGQCADPSSSWSTAITSAFV